MTSRRLWGRGSDRGSVTIELVVLAVPLLLLLGVAIGAERVQTAGQVVENAAREGARAASLTRDPATAQNEAVAVASTTLAGHANCVSPVIEVDTSGFGAPPGSTPVVVVEVSCTVPLGSLIPGLPGSVTKYGSGRSPIDVWTQR